MRYCICIFVFISAALSADAQLSYGFRAGLSYSKFLGDSELGPTGEALDEHKFASGFHIGLTMNYAVTDLFGFRGEVIFTQRGTEYLYDGPSYYFLSRRTPDQRVIMGRRIQDYNISMATFEIPLIAYFKVGSFEISGGINNAFVLSSSGGGSLNFEGTAPSGSVIDPFEVILQYNFAKDEAKAAGPATTTVRVDGVTLLTPATVGAYYDFEEKGPNQFKTYDIGLTGGLAFYMNPNLYLSGKATYGLTDVDDNRYDISLSRLDTGNAYVYRSDKNQHLTFQASIGFLF